MKQISNKPIPRGIRNNNPLNIRRNIANRWKGAVYSYPDQDPDFEEFYELKYGYRAFFILLFNYRRFYSDYSVRSIIERFAPPEDNNDTESYIKSVCRFMGVDDSFVPLTERDFIRLAVAMTNVECSNFPMTADFISAIFDGYRMAFKSKFVDNKNKTKGGV